MSPTVRSKARAELAKDYIDRQYGGFGAVLVRNCDQLFRWGDIAGNDLFLERLFSPEIWPAIEASGRTKDGQAGATGEDGEQYHDADRPNRVRYLHVTTDGKPDVLRQVGVPPTIFTLGPGMFRVAQEVAHALEEHMGKEHDSFASVLDMHPESYTTYRLLDYPAEGFIEQHRDTAALSVVMAKPGYQLLINGEWHEIEIAPWEGEGIVFIVNVGRIGSMWLTGDVRMATMHRVRTERARQTSALFVHAKPRTRWKRPVAADIPSNHLALGDRVHLFAADDFAAHGAKDDIPASS